MPDSEISTIDLSTLDVARAAEKGAVLQLTHPVSGDELGISIRLAGADSDLYQKAQRAGVNKRISKRRRTPLTPEELVEESYTLLAKISLGWTGVVLDGEALPFSFDNARMLYKRFPWIREQVDQFTADRGNFLQD